MTFSIVESSISRLFLFFFSFTLFFFPPLTFPEFWGNNRTKIKSIPWNAKACTLRRDNILILSWNFRKFHIFNGPEGRLSVKNCFSTMQNMKTRVKSFDWYVLLKLYMGIFLFCSDQQNVTQFFLSRKKNKKKELDGIVSCLNLNSK